MVLAFGHNDPQPGVRLTVSVNICDSYDTRLCTANELAQQLLEAIPFPLEKSQEPVIHLLAGPVNKGKLAIEMEIYPARQISNLQEAVVQLERAGFTNGLATLLA